MRQERIKDRVLKRAARSGILGCGNEYAE